MAYGMRTIMPMVELIDRCEKYASPDHWILNYSNPAAIVAKAMKKLKSEARILNICDMPVEIEARMAEIMNADLKELEVDCFGLNHFGWLTAVRQNGADVTERLKEHVKKYGYISEASYHDALVKDFSWLHTFENAKNLIQLYEVIIPVIVCNTPDYPEMVCSTGIEVKELDLIIELLIFSIINLRGQYFASAKYWPFYI